MRNETTLLPLPATLPTSRSWGLVPAAATASMPMTTRLTPLFDDGLGTRADEPVRAGSRNGLPRSMVGQ